MVVSGNPGCRIAVLRPHTGRRRQKLLQQPCQCLTSPRDCRRVEKSVLLEYEMEA